MRSAARETSTVRRLGKDESGMTLGLTMVIIVLIGVMGAGLLTFVSTDLGTVLEVNRGQRAFEVADAGIAVAKSQLNEDCSSGNCIDHYDDPSLGTEDSQWREANGGVTLNDLDGDGPGGTEDNVHVTIDYTYLKQEFKVVATGNYGVSKRKIEATFRGISDVIGGSGIGHPTYYTPTDIQIEMPLRLSGMSLFTEQNIRFRDVETVSEFRTLYENSGNQSNALHIPSPADNLSNWKSDDFTGGNRGWWNTQPRIGPNGRLRPPYDRPGFAAVGKIHCYTDSLTNTACDPEASIADGVYGYDSTTGPNIAPLDAVTGFPERCPTSTDPLNTKPLADRGNNWTFCEKPQALIDGRQPNALGTISFPFPRPIPNAQLLRGYAQETGRYRATSTPDWDNIFPDAARDNKVVFIDAGGDDITFNPTNLTRTYKGILVVWCGNLTMNASFAGIILNLYPNGSVGNELPGGSTCTNDYGVFRNENQTMSGWVYAQGGNDAQAGIELGPGSRMEDLTPANEWSFFNDAFNGAPPTAVQPKGWRELYEDE